MSEEENQSVETEVEEVAQPSEAEEHDDVSQEAQEAEQSKRNDAEYNWAEMRRMNAELKEEIQRLKEPEPPPKAPEEDKWIEDDDLAEGRHILKLQKELKQLKSELETTRSSSIEDRIKVNYPDYFDVVTSDNIKYLEKHEPELAETLAAHSGDNYKQRVAAYKLMKKVIVNQSPGNAIEKKKAQENSQKPVSANAVTHNSAIGNAHMFENGLTPELKKQLWNDMQTAIKSG